MAIHLPEAPPETLEIVRRDAPALLNAAPGGKMRAMAEALPEVNVTHPHQVFSATIADVLAGLVLANARETTWRFFLVHRGDEPFAAAEVGRRRADPGGPRARAARRERGVSRGKLHERAAATCRDTKRR